jgi:hypothetical protein
VKCRISEIGVRFFAGPGKQPISVGQAGEEK